ncbi:MAG TPA: site-specific integrase [Oligella sp.]|nr:site-specific integrase [Oligella sp.]
MCEEQIWTGWSFIKVSNGAGFGYVRRRKKHAVYQLSQQKNLLEILDAKVPGCKAGVADLAIPNTVLDEIDVWLDMQDSANRATTHLRRFLRAGLAKGLQELNWRVELPPTEMAFIGEQNPITPSDLIHLAKLRQQIAAFEKQLQRPVQDLSVSMLYGQMLFSAIVFGGLTDPKAMLQLPYANKNIRYHGDYVWVDLFTPNYPKHTHAQRGLRRWFPDPISLVLLDRLPKVPDEYSDKSKLRNWLNLALLRFIYSLSAEDVGRAENRQVRGFINTWRSAVNAYQHLILPPYIARYCAGEVDSTAWPEQVWLRVLVQQAVIADPVDKNISEQELSGTSVKPVQLSIDDSKKHALYRSVRAALHKDSTTREPSMKSIKERLLNLKLEAQSVSPLLYCLINWVMLRFNNKEIKRSTAYQQLTSIGRDLLSSFDEQQLLGLTAEDFHSAYENILERAPSAITRQNKADLLRRFHAHAVAVLGVEPVKLRNVDEGFYALPDANVLTEIEYQILYQFLDSKKAVSPVAHAQLIVFILGYRCGLRISEVQYIQLVELQYTWMQKVLPLGKKDRLRSCAATLLVRDDAFKKLKSVSSQRQLPLNLLMSDEELFELLNYHQAQCKKLGNGKVKNKYLFSEDSVNAEPMSFMDLQHGLHELMRQLTGDMQLRFHHLRHSFASHALQSVQKSVAPLQLPEHWQDQLLQGISRKHLHQISDYVGHNNAGVTLHHYTHNLDCLVRDLLWPHSFAHRKTGYGELQRYTSTLDVALCVQHLLGISADNLRQHNRQSNGNILGWLPQRLKLQPATDPAKWQPYSANVAKLSNEVRNKPRDLRDFSFDDWCGFLEGWSQGKNGDELIETYYLDEAVTREQIKKLSDLLKVRTRFGNSKIKTSRKLDNLNKNKDKDAPLSAHYFVIRPPRYNLEKSIARECYNGSIKLLQSTVHSEIAKTALQYFYDNYRHWDKFVTCRYDPENLSKLNALEQLLDKVLPKDHVVVEQHRNPENHRNPMMGKLKIITMDKEKPGYGAVFGLLVAYLKSRL